MSILQNTEYCNKKLSGAGYAVVATLLLIMF